MSLKLTARLDQRMVLTPQLRQRIEMLQMNSLELNELIQQEMLTNIVLEEVQQHDEVRELSENIIDQLADGFNGTNGDSATSSSGQSERFDDVYSDDWRENSANAANGNGDGNNQVSELNGLNGLNGFNETAGLNGSNVLNESGDSLNNRNETNEQTEANRENSESIETVENVEGVTEWENERDDAFEEIDYGREFQDYLDPGYRTQEMEYKEDAPSFEQFLTRSASLTEHLEWQLRLTPLDDETLEIAVCIIGNLDGDGRFTATNAEIAEMCGATDEKVETARSIVMQLEPTGCGARDVRECLLVQLESKNIGDDLTVKLIREHLIELQPHKLQNLSKALGCEVADLINQLQIIKQLDPYPGRRYDSGEPIFIAPEIYIEKIEGDYVIYFADDGSPRLRISSSYQQILSQKQTSKETRDFIREKMRSAVDLLRNIEHRRHTVYRVVECIVQRQHEFLERGVEALKPMMLKDVAEETGMHLSTISRVVNRKYAHTPQGVIELRRFFSEGMMNEDGEEVSTRIIKLHLKKMIEEENSREPVTDDQLAKILAKEGIKLSRRTVAKYRDQMQIPGSRERKTAV